MAKICITVVLDADRATIRKTKNRIMKAAHKTLVSCSASLIPPLNDSQPSEGLDMFIEKYAINPKYGSLLK